MDIRQLAFESIGALIACLAFAAIHRNNPKRIIFCGLGAVISWIAYAIVAYITHDDIFISCMIAAAVGTIVSEAFARILKAPATIFLVMAILPLVPGGSLYYATFYLVTKDQVNARINGMATALSALGIAVGLILVSVAINLKKEILQRYTLRKQ